MSGIEPLSSFRTLHPPNPSVQGSSCRSPERSGGVLVFVAPCGLPLALGCRRLWHLGYRRGAWWAGIGLGAVTVAASLLAGLLGPLAIAIYAAVISLPVWIAWWWLARRS